MTEIAAEPTAPERQRAKRASTIARSARDRAFRRIGAVVAGGLASCPTPLVAADAAWSRIHRVLSLSDYNTRVVLLGTALLGAAAGVVGVFTLLRRRSLVGDVVGHASLPGIGVAFLFLEATSPGSGRSMPALLLGAFIAGMIGVGCVTLIRRWSKVKEDAALAIVLSIFFGMGISLFTIIQSLPGGNAAGINQFILGKAASLVESDVKLIALATAAALLICIAFFKEFAVLSFDEDFAKSQGWPVLWLDLLLMGLVGAIAVVGLQSVGLLLVVALLIIPPASARFWTNQLGPLTLISALLGGLSSGVGVAISAVSPRLAAGAVIVLTGSAVFLTSLAFGRRGGIVPRWIQRRRMRNRVGRLDLMRALFECVETQIESNAAGQAPSAITAKALSSFVVSLDALCVARHWKTGWLLRLLTVAERDGLTRPAPGGYQLTQRGAEEAMRVVRNHRLWETYLIAYADVAPSHVDRDADEIEHVLDPEVIQELERLMAERYDDGAVPPSPHALQNTSPAGG